MDGLRVRVLAGDRVAVFDLAEGFQQWLDVIEFGVLRYSTDDDFGNIAEKKKGRTISESRLK